MQAINERVFSAELVLLSFLVFGLVIGIADYMIINSPGDDSIIKVFINMPVHKILEAFSYWNALVIIPVSGSFLGFIRLYTIPDYPVNPICSNPERIEAFRTLACLSIFRGNNETLNLDLIVLFAFPILYLHSFQPDRVHIQLFQKQ